MSKLSTEHRLRNLMKARASEPFHLTNEQKVSYENDVYFNKSVDALKNCEDDTLLIKLAIHIIHILCSHIAHLTAELEHRMLVNAADPVVSAVTIEEIENHFRLLSEYNCDKIATSERTLKDMYHGRYRR